MTSTSQKPSIGSYFALELPSGNDIFHNTSIRVNSGRNALEYILRVKKVKSIYIPYYFCEAILSPIRRLNLELKFYHINEDLEPLLDGIDLYDSDYFLYINYFGLCDNVIKSLVKHVPNLIVDNSQAFFSKPLENIPTFYSARKFFGVSDGAFISNTEQELILEKDFSASRIQYLISRLENEPDIAHDLYKNTEAELDAVPLKEMSDLTTKILSAIPYSKYKEIRNVNFNVAHTVLGKYNKLSISDHGIPMVYPLWITNGEEIKKQLIENRIFVASYWPNVLNESKSSMLEKSFSKDIIPIPIDQRYNSTDINYVTNFIVTLIEEE